MPSVTEKPYKEWLPRFSTPSKRLLGLLFVATLVGIGLYANSQPSCQELLSAPQVKPTTLAGCENIVFLSSDPSSFHVLSIDTINGQSGLPETLRKMHKADAKLLQESGGNAKSVRHVITLGLGEATHVEFDDQAEQQGNELIVETKLTVPPSQANSLNTAALLTAALEKSSRGPVSKPGEVERGLTKRANRLSNGSNKIPFQLSMKQTALNHRPVITRGRGHM